MAADEALLEEQYILAASTELSEEAELQMAMLVSKAEAEGEVRTHRSRALKGAVVLTVRGAAQATALNQV